MMCAPDDPRFPFLTSISRAIFLLNDPALFLIKLTCDMTALDVGLPRGIPIRESSYMFNLQQETMIK
jgi:hypothetical protein